MPWEGVRDKERVENHFLPSVFTISACGDQQAADFISGMPQRQKREGERGKRQRQFRTGKSGERMEGTSAHTGASCDFGNLHSAGREGKGAYSNIELA